MTVPTPSLGPFSRGDVLLAIAESQLDSAEQKAMFERFEKFEAEGTGAGEHERMLRLLDQTEAALGTPTSARSCCGHHVS